MLELEAFVALLIARVAIDLVPAARVLAWAARSPRRYRRDANPPTQIAATVDRLGRHTHAACLPRALAVQALLRRRGVPSRLCLGVARDGRSLFAHAWLEVDNKRVIGEIERTFTPIASFG